MELISNWIKNNNLISEYKEKISICENDKRETPYYWVRQWVYNNAPDYISSFDDSVSIGQYESKRWMINELSKINLKEFEPLHIDVIGSWFGFPLIEMLHNLFPIKQIDLYDKDENCHRVAAQYINHFDYDFRIVQYGDYFERKEIRRRHMVINTACEHMNDLKEMKKYYKGTPTMILQSNNFTQQEDHVNCCNNVEELIYKNGLAYINYSGTKHLDLYDRYMVIGGWLN